MDFLLCESYLTKLLHKRAEAVINLLCYEKANNNCSWSFSQIFFNPIIQSTVRSPALSEATKSNDEIPGAQATVTRGSLGQSSSPFTAACHWACQSVFLRLSSHDWHQHLLRVFTYRISVCLLKTFNSSTRLPFTTTLKMSSVHPEVFVSNTSLPALPLSSVFLHR